MGSWPDVLDLGNNLCTGGDKIMAGKSKHGYKIRQKPTNEWEILARNSEGEEFWYGNFTLKQNAVRWGDSHKIEGRYPQVVEDFSDPFGLSDSNATSKSTGPIDPVDRSFQQLCKTVGVDQTNRQEVAEFTSLGLESLRQISDPVSGDEIWQPLT